MTKQETAAEKKKRLAEEADEDTLQPGVEDTDDTEEESEPEASTFTPSKSATAKVVPGKKIEVDEGMLRELIESNRELTARVEKLDSNAVATGPNGLQVRRKTKEFDYTLRIWDDKVVTGFENMGNDARPLHVYNVYNKETRAQEQFVNLILEDKTTVEKVPYIDFLRDAERVKARKVSQVEHEEIEEYGMIPKKEMAENGYGMFETMVLVPVEVTTKTYTMTLKLPEKGYDGREVVINSKWLNM